MELDRGHDSMSARGSACRLVVARIISPRGMTSHRGTCHLNGISPLGGAGDIVVNALASTSASYLVAARLTPSQCGFKE